MPQLLLRIHHHHLPGTPEVYHHHHLLLETQGVVHQYHLHLLMVAYGFHRRLLLYHPVEVLLQDAIDRHECAWSRQ